MSKTNPARGMRDFLPADVRKREYVIGIIKQVYESYGFEPLETPAVENIETLMGKYGEEGNQLVFKILKRGEKLTGEFAKFSELAESENSPNSTNSVNSLTDLALRYDLTVPLARVVADRRNELPKFFKRYQIQPVWRADRPARGRFREFYQCDVDAIGSGSMIIEAEMMSAVSEIFSRLGRPTEAANFDDFVILVNHRDVLFGFGEAFKIADDKLNDALVVIDKADKIGQDAVMNELVN
jgi:histidyl-tRNA synthetase